MSSADRPGPADHSLLAAGTAAYDCHDFEALDKVPEALRDVVATLTELGFSAVAESPGYVLDPAIDDLWAAVERTAAAAPVVVVYYTGHGAHLERDTYYLVTRQSRPMSLRRTGLAARDLLALLVRRDEQGGLLADQPMVLVILDCCYSGSAGMEMLAEALRGIGNPNTWVIASAGPLEYAQQGVFAKAFCDAVRRPTIGASQDFVSLDSIVQAVNAAHPGGGQQALLFTPAGGFGGVAPFFANPAYRPGVAGLTVAEQHWLSRVRAGPEESTTGFYLTGRTGRIHAGRRLAAWMTDPGPRGLAIVTGSPGTGKSALLALPVLLAQSASRADLLCSAEPGSLVQQTADLLPADTPIIAVNARGLNPDQVAGAIARALGRAPGTASAVLEDLDASPERAGRVVAVDAVDEAATPDMLLTNLLLPLARRPGLRVAVAARRHVLSRVGEADLTIDLDSSQYRDPSALADYVHRLLVASEEPDVTTPYQPDRLPGNGDEVTAAVAAAIAQRATADDGGPESFLIARLLALSVRGRAERVDVTGAGWQSELPASIAEAFDQDLARLGDKESLARLLLAALAWAKGPGLPWENIWVRVARALAEHDGPPRARLTRSITDDDVRWLLSKAGAYVVEDLGPGQRSVYRPFHDLLAAHLRAAPGSRPADSDPAQATAWQRRQTLTEEAITDALLDTMPAVTNGRDWESAHPYLRTYLSQHAAAAGSQTLSALGRDPDFLAITDPITFTPLLPAMAPELRQHARAYLRARPLLGDDARANAAYLNEAAGALTGAAAPETAGIRPLYRTRLASVRRDDSLLTLTAHTGSVYSVALGSGPDGRLLLASGSGDQTVRLWDPVTGAPVGEPLTGHIRDVTCVAFGPGPGGRLLLASGSYDDTVRLWDPLTGNPVGEPLTGHTGHVDSVAFDTRPGGRLLASGSEDGTVRLWDPVTGAPFGEPLTGHTGKVTCVAFGPGPGGRLLLASGSYDQTVRLWDPLTGNPVGEPLTGHTGYVDSVAFDARPGGRLLATGSWDDTVRLWDPLTGAPVGEPLIGHTSQVSSVAFGTGPDGRLLLATGSGDDTVRLWDPLTGSSVGEPLVGHTRHVSSVAFDTRSGGRLLATGSWDDTVRLWDPFADAPAAEPLTGHIKSVKSVAFGTGPNGRLLLASGSYDDPVRLWDPMSGTPVGQPLAGRNSYATSLAFGTGSDGRPLLACGWGDGTVCLWDPVTGTPVGEPLTGAPVTRPAGRSQDMFQEVIQGMFRTNSVDSVAFGTGSAGRPVLAVGGGDGTVRVWDPVTGALVRELLISGMAIAIQSVALGMRPDGRPLLACASSGFGEGANVRVWDLMSGAVVGRPLGGRNSYPTSVAFGTGPDGRPLLASGWNDGTVRLSDPVTSTPGGEPFTGHTSDVTSVAFGPGLGGRLLLASGSTDKQVRLWEPASGRCAAILRRRSSVRSIAMASGLLAIGDDEGVSVIELDE